MQKQCERKLESCQTKTAPKIFVIVIPNEALAGITPSSSITPTIGLCYVVFTDYYFTYSVIPIEGLAGLVPAKASFGVTMTRFLRPVLR